MRKVLNETMSDLLMKKKQYSTAQMCAFYVGIAAATILSYVLPVVV